MSALPEVIDVRGIPFSLIDAPTELSCWSGDLPGDGYRRIHLVMEPAGPATGEAIAAAEIAVDEFDALVAAASAFLLTELQDATWALDAQALELLRGPEAPFARPEAVIWRDGSWMLRFDECVLAMGEEYGIGVLFDGRTPIQVEDLSDVDDIDDGTASGESASA